MKNYDESVEINHNPNWAYIPDYPHRILIIDCSGSGKTNVLLSLIKKSTNRYCKNLFIHQSQRSICIQVQFTY